MDLRSKLRVTHRLCVESFLQAGTELRHKNIAIDLGEFVWHTGLFETLSHHSGVALMVFDKNGCLRATHGDAFEHVFGHCFEAGTSVDEVYRSMPEHGALYWKALQQGLPSNARFQRAQACYNVHIVPLVGASGGITGVVGIGRDISAALSQEGNTSDSQQLEYLLNNSQDAIFMVDRKYRVQRYNPVVAQSCSEGPITGTRCHQRFFGFDDPCPFCPVTECFRTGKATFSTCRQPWTGHYYNLQAVPIFDPQSGEMTGAIEICRDIDDLKEFEQTVRGHERGQLMLDAIPLCCCLFDSDLRMIECNREAVDFLRCKNKEEALNCFTQRFPFMQPCGNTSASVVLGSMRRALTQGRSRGEWTFELPGGELVPAHVDLVPVTYGDEQLLAVYARDLREEKAMRAEVEEAQERIRVMFESAPFGCTMSDKNFTDIDCNSAILRMHELKDKAHYIDRFMELSPPFQPCGRPSPEMAAEHLNKCFEEGYHQFEWMHRTMSDEPLPVEITIMRVMVRGRPLVAGYVRDLRELKKTQAALDRERAELVLAKEAAEAASRTKSTFLANMSHEIRTPMNAILGLAYLAIQGDTPEAQRDVFRKIHSAATGLLGVINDILDFSKIEASKLELSMAPFSLASELKDLKDIIRVRVREKSIDLVFRMSPDVEALGYLSGDAARLRQVLVNLLGNAVKFTDRGGVVFEVEAESPPDGDTGRTTLVFSIQDTGIGIDPAALRNLFQPFSQADGSITRRFGGTGLGLAISRQIVDIMGGEMEVFSQPDEGSLFVVRLPFALAEAPTAAENTRSQSLNSLRGRRVLVVEDNDINQIVALSLLEQVGMVAACADNGLDALRLLERQSFDLVLMDIQMPVMDGLEATRRLRRMGDKNPALRTLPVVAMTAHAMSDDHDKSLAAGMDDHITKPIDPQRLYATLCRWIR